MMNPTIPCLSNDQELQRAVVELVDAAPLFKRVVTDYGPPPLWKREEGFPTLIRIILEQQVSLASARAAFDKLVAASGELLPERFVRFSDQKLKTIGFSRQKTQYGRALSEAIISSSLDLTTLPEHTDEEVRQKLTAVKGIGVWTANIYLLMAMGRPDVWPTGDIALAASYATLNELTERPNNEDMKEIATEWQPYRSVAARLLWHNYLSDKQK
ncbi:DNA-3-methyladenine glycosylase [Desulfopila sp. IMCC35008]|uniref:DNA-3-methyladenine glycosylase family protein n=1 Tax=Desulfopila sp. IMCC35008 TaxID=2653858 RepID=UPI0013D827A9|nr:DNA-3-methyladenine glycosylase 2 family protein [Desulfopila sp. IMCC35008]